MSFSEKVVLEGTEESLVISEITILEAENSPVREMTIDDLYNLVDITIDVQVRILSE